MDTRISGRCNLERDEQSRRQRRQSFRQNETETILALYAAVLAADLATGADLAGGAAVASWASLLSLHEAVRRENWRPNIWRLTRCNCISYSTMTNS